MSKVIYFTAGMTPTTGELADIATLNNAAKAPYQVVVRRRDASQNYGAGPEDCDYVAGTIPDTGYGSKPVLNPASLPPTVNEGASVNVKNSAGNVTKPGTAHVAGGSVSVSLAATVALVANGDTRAGVTGSGTTATISVAGGVITGIALS